MQDLTSFFWYIGEPGGYLRVTIGVARTYYSTPAPIAAIAYVAQYPSARST